MKKITLLLALLMWSSNFYAQTYFDEGFESGIPVTWADEAGTNDVGAYPWASTAVGPPRNNSGITGHLSSQAAWFDEVFDLFPFSEDVNTPVRKHRFLVSPVMDLSGATSPELTYYEAVRYKDFTPPIQNRVRYSTNYTPGNAATATWTLLNGTFGSDAELDWKIRGAFALPAVANIVIAFEYDAIFATEWFIDDVLVRETPTCVEPSAGSIANITFNSADFSWTSGPGGTETLWDVELVDLTGGETKGTGTEILGVTNPYTFTSLASGNNYEAYVRADCGAGGKSEWFGSFAFATPANNNECVNAISVTHQSNIVDEASAVETAGTVESATDSSVAQTCGGTPNDDVWFSFVATSTSVTVRTETASATFDAVIELFSGACGALVSVACEDFGGDGDPDNLIFDGLIMGNTYYVRVYDWDGALPPPVNGVFSLKVFRGSIALGVEDLVEDNEFRFYPNPVKDILKIKSQKNIENISIYNLLGQEVYRKALNSRSGEVDMSALQTGSYFVKITVNGITETKQIIKR